jgi:hypothetical protein
MGTSTRPSRPRSVRTRTLTEAGARLGRTGRLPRATHGDESRPLRVMGLELPCYVLEDERRVLAQRGMYVSLALKRGGVKSGGDRLSNFLSSGPLTAFISKGLLAAIKHPIRFLPPHGGIPAYGYEATVLADICDAILAARKAGALKAPYQLRAADQCELLTRAFAKVGIIALVDEATGYQADRARDALAEILEKYIAKELRKWVKTFPSEFYEQMFRLQNWQFHPLSVKRPGVVGRFTNQIVYERLAPGVLQELRDLTPRDDKGRLKHRLFQRLTEDVGHPQLREHLAVVVALMKLSRDWSGFVSKLDRVAPRFGRTYSLPLDND